MNRISIIGSKGQDGRLLSRHLKEKGHFVSEIARGDLDLVDHEKVLAYLSDQAPDEVYYLAAYQQSAEDSLYDTDAKIFENSFSTNVMGLIAVLDGIRRLACQTRVFYAASSHVFGAPEVSPQNEGTPFRPENIYGISKTAGIEACRFYRKRHEIFAACGILYNHESALRSEKFVMKKVIAGALRILRKEQEFLILGDLKATVDWGHAQDYVEAMTCILSQPSPDDYIIATGETHSVQELVEIVFAELGLDWTKHIQVDSSILKKPAMTLRGDAAKLRVRGWRPAYDFPTMVKSILADLQRSA